MDPLAIVVLSATAILGYSVNALLLGIAFQALQIHRKWAVSPAMKLIYLLLGCAFLGNYLWPMAYVLDVSFTVRNPAVAEIFDFRPDHPYVVFSGSVKLAL